MASHCCVDVKRFCEVTQTHLETCDLQGLVMSVQSQWRPSQIAMLLGHEEVCVRRLATVTLGLLGDPATVCSLARALHDPDAQVRELTEHALWTLWFQLGDPASQDDFVAGLDEAELQNLQAAIAHFTRAIELDPTFAEPYHQRALAYAALEQWPQCLDDCRACLSLMPQHFSAVTTVGHCFTQLGDLRAAAEQYRLAMSMNPRLRCDLGPVTAKLESFLAQQQQPTDDTAAAAHPEPAPGDR
jgi:tetratricopeptide (TPR) repeat protein